MPDHEHVTIVSQFFCETCGEPELICEVCEKEVHICVDAKVKTSARTLPRGFMVILDHPEYMINKEGSVKKISNGDRCPFIGLTASGEALIRIRVNGKHIVRSVQKLREEAFPV